jgi:N-acyl-D-aspartate/D-glutamate deacylase
MSALLGLYSYSTVLILFGLTDVGTLRVGMKANLNVIDLEKLSVGEVGSTRYCR